MKKLVIILIMLIGLVGCYDNTSLKTNCGQGYKVCNEGQIVNQYSNR